MVHYHDVDTAANAGDARTFAHRLLRMPYFLGRTRYRPEIEGEIAENKILRVSRRCDDLINHIQAAAQNP